MCFLKFVQIIITNISDAIASAVEMALVVAPSVDVDFFVQAAMVACISWKTLGCTKQP